MAIAEGSSESPLARFNPTVGLRIPWDVGTIDDVDKLRLSAMMRTSQHSKIVAKQRISLGSTEKGCDCSKVSRHVFAS